MSVSVAACAAAVLVTGVAAPASAYSTGRSSQLGVAECAYDINERGVIVLRTQLYRNGRSEPLPGGLTTGSLVNNRGHVVGAVDGQTALWNGTETVLITPVAPEDTWAFVTAINERGDVVGTSSGLDGTSRAFLRTREGVVTVLSAPGVKAGANGLNDRGQVVGYVFEDGVQVAVRWNKDGSTTRLAPLAAGAGALADDINDNGQVVGYSYDASGNGRMHAVRWTRADRVESLDPVGTTIAGAVDVNRYGRVVGSLALDGSSQQPFVRDSAGPTRVVPLSQPGNVEVLTAVNDYGTAVGCSYGDLDEESALVWRS
ncbi:hypothetical protein [Cellulomonas cellasea]|uniref:Putative HAF family extracellular repeat protein n=1 Tax=Cellulomonas cellasea TaxID=43670 RepID=A0A7W4YAU7_9CELL|nr:hypothetical protein [Cellulomonas cellasea]MBB2922419.1 putative HAF family extracellular repeat protein [Cellulomonas cellasea]